MKIRGKEEILFAALQLAAEKGLRAVSMSMIAEKVGMKKPSLYNHFASKEELVREMYLFLREKAKRDGNVSAFAAETLPDLPAEELLQTATENYLRITESAEMQTFYKVLYSERTFSEIAAQILTEETEKMIGASAALLTELQRRNLLSFADVDTSAMSFALTVHGMMDYFADRNLSKKDTEPSLPDCLQKYIAVFCREHRR